MGKLIDTSRLIRFKNKLLALVGVSNGIAGLDSQGKVPTSQLPSLLSLGETSSTAYRGDRGAEAYAAAVTYKTSTVSLNNANIVTSGGVYTALTSKSDKSATVSNVSYDSTNKKIRQTINGTTSDIVAVSAIQSALGSFTWGALAGQ